MKKLAPLFLVVGLAVAGCSSAESEADCLPVKDAMLQAVSEGSNEYKMIPSEGSAVKSGNYYYIAMKYKTETLSGKPIADGDVALWASTDLDATGSIQSVDNMASGFTAWPKNVWGLNLTDDEATQAKKCLG